MVIFTAYFFREIKQEDRQIIEKSLHHIQIRNNLTIYEPSLRKDSFNACVDSECSDQTALWRSLIRACAVHTFAYRSIGNCRMFHWSKKAFKGILRRQFARNIKPYFKMSSAEIHTKNAKHMRHAFILTRPEENLKKEKKCTSDSHK